MTTTNASYYLRPAFDRAIYDTIVTRCAEIVKKLGVKTIAFRGLSGSLVAPTVCYLTGAKMFAVRKGEPTHGQDVEGDIEGPVLILDDLISTGTTMKEILAHLPKEDVRGILLYHDTASHVFYPYMGDDITVFSFCVPEGYYSDNLRKLLNDTL